jgi:long-chain acyl-CoA synthetase
MVDGETPLKVGEIVAEGDNVALGYALPDPAKNPFRDGKLHTGDLAYMDDEGYLFITGRSSEFLKLSGHRVSAREIEDALYTHPDVLEAAVRGEQRDDGEIAKAYVVIKPGSALTAEQIVAHCKRNLPLYAVPSEVALVADLPKNSAGKILKSKL